MDSKILNSDIENINDTNSTDDTDDNTDNFDETDNIIIDDSLSDNKTYLNFNYQNIDYNNINSLLDQSIRITFSEIGTCLKSFISTCKILLLRKIDD